MKKIIALTLLIFVLALSLTLPTLAAPEGKPLLIDNADLLTESEEANISSRLKEIHKTYSVDLVIVTVDSTKGKTPEAFADDYFDYNGYGVGESRDGALLLIDIGGRKWHISTCGSCIDSYSDYGIEYIGECMGESLTEGNYAEAFEIFINESEYYLDGSIGFFPCLIIALFAGLLIALIVTLIMRGQLKTVRPQYSASDYVKRNSLNITEAYEIFLYRNVTRIARPKQSGSSTHFSSSGTRHGGGGGSF